MLNVKYVLFDLDNKGYPPQKFDSLNKVKKLVLFVLDNWLS